MSADASPGSLPPVARTLFRRVGATPRRLFPLWTLFFALLAAQLACGLGSQNPRPAPPATLVAQPTAAIHLSLRPAVTEERMLTLEYPPTLRAGDADVVRLTLEIDVRGNLTPTAEFQGSQIQGEILQIPNIYNTHNVMAEARLDLAGMEVQPAETVSETLLPGQKLTFYWSIRPAEVGHYKGTVWFYLRFIPRAGGADSRQALSAQLIEIEAVTLFGLKAGLARWLGLVGAVLSSVLGFPFLEVGFKWLWVRIRSGK